MKNLLFSLLFTCSITSWSQQLSINCNLEQGELDTFYQVVKNKVFKINANGQLSEILLFKTDAEAQAFIDHPKAIYKPCKSILAGQVRIYLETYTSLNYYGSYSKGLEGKVRSIDQINITYYEDYQRNSGKVGKIKSFDGINIAYFGEYNDYSGYVGKLRSIGGNIRFAYFGNYKVYKGKVGKFSSINGISVDYYIEHSMYKGIVGKLKRIGHIYINY